MIKSLIKYDVKKMTVNMLVYVYVIAIALSLLTRFINIWDDIHAVAILGAVFEGIVYSALGSILINTFVQILRVFIVNFYKDESYLTHTLPVSKSKLLLSKYISSLIVIFASVLVCFVCLFIVFYSKEFAEMLKMFLEISVAGFDMSVGLFIALFALIIFSQICAIISMAFCAIVKGFSYNSKRVLRSFLWFIVYYMGAMVVTLISVVIVFAISGNAEVLLANVLPQSAFLTLLILALVLYLIYSLVFYYICNRTFNKGVNVD